MLLFILKVRRRHIAYRYNQRPKEVTITAISELAKLYSNNMATRWNLQCVPSLVTSIETFHRYIVNYTLPTSHLCSTLQMLKLHVKKSQVSFSCYVHMYRLYQKGLL